MKCNIRARSAFTTWHVRRKTNRSSSLCHTRTHTHRLWHSKNIGTCIDVKTLMHRVYRPFPLKISTNTVNGYM